MNQTKEGSKVIQESFSLIEKLYDLKTIYYKENVGHDFFHRINKTFYFIVVALFDEEDRIFIMRDLSKVYGWELLGSAINANDFIDIESKVQKVSEDFTGTRVYDISPIIQIENVFLYQGQRCIHKGLAFFARPINPLKVLKYFEWAFVKELPQSMFMTNRKIAKYAKKVIEDKKYLPPREEIVTAELLTWRRKIHKFIINPPFDVFSSSKIKDRIRKYIPDQINSFLDISAGDDEFLVEISKRKDISLIVCNDVSPTSPLFFKKVMRSDSNVLKNKFFFTNHDIREFPLRYKFDVVICKNTLHHLSNRDKKKALETLKRVGKRIIIIDVENPLSNGFFAKLWNTYYIKFLHDQGKYFLNKYEFQTMIRSFFNDHTFTVETIQTVKGNYLLAVID